MPETNHSVLLIGESGVGKTHYGAQLLSRLYKTESCELTLDTEGHQANLDPYETTFQKLNAGLAAEHTTSTTFIESIWPVVNKAGVKSQLVWPEYAGEQVSLMLKDRNLPEQWLNSIREGASWLLMIRLNLHQDQADILSKPVSSIHKEAPESPNEVNMSHQARLIELLQIMLFGGGVSLDKPVETPKLAVMLTCWDELGLDLPPPEKLLETEMPMLHQFITSIWEQPLFFGLSALGKALSSDEADEGYVNLGPEAFGYIVNPEGTKLPDLTIPLRALLDEPITKGGRITQ